jgi:peptidylprolyl isomerase/FKBP-type peptidyl-prolyl cis-trans isomerase FkpA
MNTEKWIAVVAGIFIVGFFFVFGPTLAAIFNPNISQNMNTQPKLISTDTVVGTGEVAETGDLVTVHYTGRFVDGRVFDSSIARGEPFQFVLGTGQVIAGWDQGIVGMKVGGTRELSIPPELGYGKDDYGPIPGNSTLIFDIQLLKVQKQ